MIISDMSPQSHHHAVDNKDKPNKLQEQKKNEEQKEKEKHDPQNSPKDASKRKSSASQGGQQAKKGKAASPGAKTAQAMKNFHQAIVVGKSDDWMD